MFGHFNAKHDLASALSTEICISCLLIKYVYAKVCVTVGAYYMHRHYKNAMLWYLLHYVLLQFTLLIIYTGFLARFPKSRQSCTFQCTRLNYNKYFCEGRPSEANASDLDWRESSVKTFDGKITLLHDYLGACMTFMTERE